MDRVLAKQSKCFNPNFELIGQIKIPELVSNCECGGKEGSLYYITLLQQKSLCN